MTSYQGIALMLGVLCLVGLVGFVSLNIFDLSKQSNKIQLVGATAHQSGDQIIVTYYGGAGQDQVRELIASISGNVTRILNPVVGSSLTGIGTSGRDHVTVTAVYDGYTQMVLDTYV